MARAENAETPNATYYIICVGHYFRLNINKLLRLPLLYAYESYADNLLRYCGGPTTRRAVTINSGTTRCYFVNHSQHTCPVILSVYLGVLRPLLLLPRVLPVAKTTTVESMIS